jgi:hypothetical protein
MIKLGWAYSSDFSEAQDGMMVWSESALSNDDSRDMAFDLESPCTNIITHGQARAVGSGPTAGYLLCPSFHMQLTIWKPKLSWEL